MWWIFVILFILILIITGSYCAYRLAFHVPQRADGEAYRMPQGTQYDVFRDPIAQSANEMLERPFEWVSITSHDGKKLYARYYHVADGAPLQIQFHGYKSSPYIDCCGGSKLAGRLGQNALVVDQRSHGKSEGNTITFGVLERRDCLDWIFYARKRFGYDVKIILAGLSMGAATVLMATDLELPENVVGVMADCPYSSPKAIIQKVCREDMHLPPKLVYPFVKLGARLFGNFNLEESNAVEAVANARIPILLIHGEDDRFVPCDMSREIQHACTGNITCEYIPGAGHGLSYMTDPKRYEQATVTFIKNVLE